MQTLRWRFVCRKFIGGWSTPLRERGKQDWQKEKIKAAANAMELCRWDGPSELSHLEAKGLGLYTQ